MNNMGPSERKRLNLEVVNTLGHGPEHAFNMQKFREEQLPAHQKGYEEFMRKEPATRKAWHDREAHELMTPHNINADPDAQTYEHEFMKKSHSMASKFGENPTVKPFLPKSQRKGGRKTKRSKHSNKSRKSKKSRKKRSSRRKRR